MAEKKRTGHVPINDRRLTVINADGRYFYGGKAMNSENKRCPMFRPSGLVELLTAEEADINFARIGMRIAKKIIPGTKLLMISDERGILKAGDSSYQILPIIIVKQKETTIGLLNDDEFETALSLMRVRQQILIVDGREVPAYQM